MNLLFGMCSSDKDFIKIIYQFLLPRIGSQINMNALYWPAIIYGIRSGFRWIRTCRAIWTPLRTGLAGIRLILWRATSSMRRERFAQCELGAAQHYFRLR